jgi:hypothetical protein
MTSMLQAVAVKAAFFGGAAVVTAALFGGVLYATSNLKDDVENVLIAPEAGSVRVLPEAPVAPAPVDPSPVVVNS